MKKLLIPLFFIILFVPANAMAYPVQFGDNAAQVVSLKNPTISIDTSSFESKNSITVNLEFENKNTTYDGLIWTMVQLSSDDVTASLEEIFNSSDNSNRMIGLTINGLDYSLFDIDSDYNLIATVDPENGLQNTLQLEILDIEQNVEGDNSKSSLEFDFEISSSEFKLGEEYDLELFISASGVTSKTFELKEPVVETPKETIPDPVIEDKPVVTSEQIDSTVTASSNSGLASFVDSSKDPQHYIDRYNNESTYKKWFDDNFSQYDSIYDAVGVDESKKSEIKCGLGMESKNGYCVRTQELVSNSESLPEGFTPEPIDDEEPKSEGFLDWLFALFG